MNLLESPYVSCDASYFESENVSLTWSLNGKALAADKAEKDKFADNSATFKITLDYKLTRLDDQMNLTCSLVVENRVLGYYETDTTVVVNLYCKYSW